MKKSAAWKDLRAAIDRLKKGTPEEAKNIDQLSKGRLKINAVTVAREARRSRTLIGMTDCEFPDLRNEVLQLNGRAVKEATLIQQLAAARKKIQELQEDRQLKDTVIANLVLAVEARDAKIQSFDSRGDKVRHIGTARRG